MARGHGSARSTRSPRRARARCRRRAPRARRRRRALGELHHVVVVGERLIRLEHRELGVVAGVDALVAEHAPDLEHALEPADDEALEVQLERDAEVEVDVERVVVGDERARGRAAELVVEHRGLDLDEAAFGELAVGSRRRPRTGSRTPAGRRRSRSGRRSAAGTGCRRRRGRATCRAAGAAPWRAARSRVTFTDSSPLRVVITVPSTPTQSPRSSCVERGVGRLAELAAVETNSWIAARLVAHGRERQLALTAEQQDPARDPHRDVGLGAGFEVAELGAELGEGAVAVEADRIRIDAARRAARRGRRGDGPARPARRATARSSVLSGRSSGIRSMLGAAIRRCAPFAPGRLGRHAQRYDAAAAIRRSNMEAVIVATARTPIGRANKGSLVDLPPRRPRRRRSCRRCSSKVPALDPGRGRGRHLGLRAARRRGRLQPRPRHRAARRARRRAGRHRQPLLLVVAADHPHGRARDQGRRGRRVRRRRRRDREPVRDRACPTAGPARTTRSSRDAEARTEDRTRGRPAEPWDADRRPPRHLHRDGPDRGERRRVRQGDPRGDGRVRRAVAAARGRVAGERVLRARDHARHHARRHRRHQGRRPPPGHHRRGARRSSSRCSDPTAPSPPATRARSTTAPPRCS